MTARRSGPATAGGPAHQWKPAEAGIHPSPPMSAARNLVTTPELSRATELSPAALYETHLRRVWRNLRRLGVAEEALEDAVQDVFVAVHRRWDTYDDQASSVETWLFGIVIRVAQSHRRMRRRRLARLWAWFQERASHETFRQSDDPAEMVAKREATLVLNRILEELSDRERDVLVLVDVEQMSVREAAEVLSINVNTAYTRLRAARLRFQRAVDQLRAAEHGQERGGGHE